VLVDGPSRPRQALHVAEQPLSARRRVVTLVAMCVAQGMILLDNTIVNV
jgi:hypothetical protein